MMYEVKRMNGKEIFESIKEMVTYFGADFDPSEQGQGDFEVNGEIIKNNAEWKFFWERFYIAEKAREILEEIGRVNVAHIENLAHFLDDMETLGVNVILDESTDFLVLDE